MKRAVLILMLVATVFAAHSQQEGTAVFVSGNEGHKSYRIPAVIGLRNGTLLAFCEGRVHGAGDFGDINIVLKKSTDKGRTWGRMETVVDYDTLQAGNPAPVVDYTDPLYPSGRIFLFYNTGNNHEGEVRKGRGVREVWYKTSTDGGNTWSDPVNITTQVHHPKQPSFNSAYNSAKDWRSYANTPGHALQFSSGKYKGRIYVAANHNAGDPQKQFSDYKAHGFYTDDHGKTFQLSEDVSFEGGNEAMAAVASDGRLIMNIRNQKGDVRSRIVATSSNGGQSWDTTYFDRNLPDPVCQGSILNIDNGKRKSVLAFCNAADEKKRDNLTLRISYDDGNTWKKNITVAKSPTGAKDYAAYSDIISISKNEIGVLFENDNYSKIVFKNIKWK
ncbi:exo-alpha-sialidase [Flavihumibacter solisilvae]|uniref:exo-alpha-sialidase n=2 Tax=Flavihumibacter solisilvae TaxID=1349421 RepID=A0A0C1IK10_9BACT|nr:exo-alpha-sialidase [Flavihumibacter solisilvae]